AGEVMGLLEQLERLLQIDDVDAAALREDEAAHLGIPAARLVAEMDAGLQQLPHRDDRHGYVLLAVGFRYSRRRARVHRQEPAPPPVRFAGTKGRIARILAARTKEGLLRGSHPHEG